MSRLKEQYIGGQQRILDHNPSLNNAAILVLNRLVSNPNTQSVTLPGEDYADYNNLFLNCVKRRGGRIVLDIGALKEKIPDNFSDWLDALKTSSGFVAGNGTEGEEDLLSSLRFQIPAIDWLEFATELKRESQESLPTLRNAWKTAEYLMNLKETVAPAELGARLFHDSKYLKTSSVLTWACRFLRQKNTLPENLDDSEILEKFGLVANPTASTVMIYGAFVYQASGTAMTWIRDLWTKGQSAILSGDNLTGFSGLQIEVPVLTIENETVFNKMKQAGPEQALIYTAGFPGRAVRQFIGMLPTSVELYHWGDSDPEGYEIAAILNRIHPLKLFRCSSADLARQKRNCIPLSPAKRKRAERLLQTNSFPFSEELEWILQNNLWLEQESYVPEKKI